MRLGAMQGEPNDKVTVVICVEGVKSRYSVREMTFGWLRRTVINFAMEHRKSHKRVYFYLLDEAANTWTRSQKFYYFRNSLMVSDVIRKGVTEIPELA